MDSVTGSLNSDHCRELFADGLDKKRRKHHLQLLGGKEDRLAAVSQKGSGQTEQYIRDFSQVPFHGCNQQSVKDSLLKLRRGPVLYHRDNLIFLEGDPAEYIMLVVNGVVRTCRHYKDGSRSIATLHFAGEALGWNDDLLHSLTAEAATDTVLLYIKRSALNSLATRDRRVADFILTATRSELRRSQEYSLLICKDAKSRVSAFLIDLWARMGKPKLLKLPMTYLDVADHLGLTLETLSRTISILERAGMIARVSRRTLAVRVQISLMQIAN